MEFKRVSKKAIINMLIPAAIWFIILGGAFSVLWFTLIKALEPKFIGYIYLAAVLFVELLIICSPFIRYKRYRYQIDDTRVAVKEGLIFITTETAPIERVHQISVSAGPVDRLTGLAKVTVTTAGGEIVVRFLEKDLADQLSQKIEKTVKSIVIWQVAQNGKE